MPSSTPQHDRCRRRQGGPDDVGRKRHDDDALLQQPGPRRRARLPPRGAAGRRPRHPHPPRRMVPPPPVGPLNRMSTGAVLSPVRATIDAVPRWDDAPLVGRADELARLLTHVEWAEAGRASAVLLAGDAGVGKTRLLDELTAKAS